MESTASAWLITDLVPNNDSFWLGIMAAAFAIPMLALPPFGGAIADRFPRVRLLWIVQILYLLLSTALAALTLAGVVQVWMLIVYSFGNGMVLAFDSPIRHSVLPDIVTREQLSSAVSLNSVAFSGAALIGPAIAGLLIPFIGVGGVMTVNAVSCVATLVALSKLRNLPAQAKSTHGGNSVLQSIGQGVRYIASTPMLLGLIIISTISGFLSRSYGPMLAVFARDEFNVGSSAYGAMVSVGGLGTLIGAFGLAGRRDVHNKGRLVLITTISQGILLFLFAISPWFAMTLPILGLMGVTSAISGAIIATLIQLSVPGEMRGRVISLYLLTVIGVPSIGSFALGALAVPLGVRAAVASAAIAVVVGVGIVYSRNEAIRHAS